MLEFLQAITGVFVVVYEGQHALKFTLGRAGPVVGPGVHWKWPIVQKFKVKDTKHTTLDLEPQVIQLADDLVYEVDCKVLYQIVNLRKAVIEIDDLVTGLKNRVVLAVQQVVGARRIGRPSVPFWRRAAGVDLVGWLGGPSRERRGGVRRPPGAVGRCRAGCRAWLESLGRRRRWSAPADAACVGAGRWWG